MKKKIAFIAVGQAGGNIGKELEKQGFKVLYINTSKEDLNTLDNTKFTYHITNGEGCNKDRDKAKKLIIDDFDNIAQEIDNKLPDCDIFYVIFASGGGTGSGAGPMLVDLLTDDGRTTGAITIIPADYESVKANLNSYACFTELCNITNSAGVFVLDNNKGEILNINATFSDAFTKFVMIPELHKDVTGNIDRAEIIETLKTHGMSIVVTTEKKEQSDVIKAMNDNVFAPLENDRVIKYITYSEATNIDIQELEKAVGLPLDWFKTKNAEETIVMLSGLSFPVTRLEEVYKKVDGNKEQIMKNLKIVSEVELKGDVDFLGSMQPSSKKLIQEDKKPKSKRDIMSKYLNS